MTPEESKKWFDRMEAYMPCVDPVVNEQRCTFWEAYYQAIKTRLLDEMAKSGQWVRIDPPEDV